MRFQRVLCVAWVFLHVSTGITFASTIQADASVNLVQSDSNTNSDPNQQFVSAQEAADGITASSSASLIPVLSVFASSSGQHLGEANGNSSFQGTFHLSPEITLADAPLVLSFNFDFQGSLAVTPGDPHQGFSTALSEMYLTTTAFSGASLVNVSGALAFVAGVTSGGGTYTDTLVRTGLFEGDAGNLVSHSFSLPVTLTSRYNYGTLALFLNCTATSSASSAASCDSSQGLSLSSVTVEQGGVESGDFYVNFDAGPSIPVSVSKTPNPPPTLTPEPQTLIPVSLGGLFLMTVQRRRI